MLVTWLGHSCISMTSDGFTTMPVAGCFWLEAARSLASVPFYWDLVELRRIAGTTSRDAVTAENDLRTDGVVSRQTVTARQSHWGVRLPHALVR
jgi:hypothetical protein